MSRYQHLAYIFIILILLGGLFSIYSRQAGMIEATDADSLLRSKDVVIDRMGRESVILVQQKQELASALNGANKELRAMMNKSTEVAVKVKVVTKDSTVTKVDTVIYAMVDSAIQEIRGSWKDQWSEGEIIARKDSIVRRIVMYNDFGMQVENQRRYFKPDEARIIITNNNPHTRTINEQAFVLKQDKKRHLGWFGAGICVGLAGFLLLTK